MILNSRTFIFPGISKETTKPSGDGSFGDGCKGFFTQLLPKKYLHSNLNNTKQKKHPRKHKKKT